MTIMFVARRRQLLEIVTVQHAEAALVIAHVAPATTAVERQSVNRLHGLGGDVLGRLLLEIPDAKGAAATGQQYFPGAIEGDTDDRLRPFVVEHLHVNSQRGGGNMSGVAFGHILPSKCQSLAWLILVLLRQFGLLRSSQTSALSQVANISADLAINKR